MTTARAPGARSRGGCCRRPRPHSASRTAADGIELSAEQLAELDNLTPAAGEHHDEAGTRLLGR
ncbi:hypothetical protein ACIA6D_29835 [Streptomyces cacaoi]|uniref:hypothetical protein n=1 Tax=Streptomyces cacaoi TaxID=1898 RepID=UPI00374A3BC6